MENHMRDIINDISALSVQPEFRSKEYLAWVKQASFIKFIQKSNSRSHIILYASAPHLYMYSVLVANTILKNFKPEDLEDWDCRPDSSWGITYNMGDNPKIWISAPMESSRPNIFEGGEQVIFSRRFDGRREHKHYFEMSQRLAHSFGLHWVPENDAFCRLDEGGEIEEIVKVTEFKIPHESEEITIVTIRRDVLDEYLVMTNQIMVSMYDSTRFDIKNFTSWEGTKLTDYSRKPNIYFKFGKHGATESYLKGFQLILPKLTLKDVYESHHLGSRKNKKYATFIIQDWKNKKVREWSCDPKKMGNYFVKSKLPFETSPVFFKPEVLHKYKADTEKYDLRERSIDCKNAWHLKTYDINSAGQVHTYLVYLSHLPHQEQLYWKSFNEAPKATISRRAFTTDFEGTWDKEYDALHSLKEIPEEFSKAKVTWWTLRDEKLPKVLHYPATNSSDEWAKEILTMDKFINEGFVVEELRKFMVKLGVTYETSWRSLKLVESILQKVLNNATSSKELVEPLKEVNHFRNKVAGHSSGKEAEKIRLDVLKKHKTYPIHFKKLCKSCDKSIREIAKILNGIK